jgi:hypothetical protein
MCLSWEMGAVGSVSSLARSTLTLYREQKHAKHDMRDVAGVGEFPQDALLDADRNDA